MNYKITFSTYINKTGASTGRNTLRHNLQAIAGDNHIQGFTLQDQTGYWAGEYEASHSLTLLDTSSDQAHAVALSIKKLYSQNAVILEPLQDNGVEFI